MFNNDDNIVIHMLCYAGFALTVSLMIIGVTSYKQSDEFKQDKYVISALASFTAKNNPNVQSDYDKLAEYSPKTDEGERLKSEKMSQKINEIQTFKNK